VTRLALGLTILVFTLGLAALLVLNIAESGTFGPLEAVTVLILVGFVLAGVGVLRQGD